MWKDSITSIGQGNGAGPQIWAAVSTPLFNIMRQECFVVQFICALLHQHKILDRLAFIDTDLIVNDKTNKSVEVIEKMQNSLMMWHGLLWATGGELVPDKCFWYMIDFKWQNQQWAYKNLVELPGKIHVTINQNEKIIIPRLETSEARRTLGIQLVPDSNDEMEAQYLQEVAVEWARKMARSTLSRADAEFSL